MLATSRDVDLNAAASFLSVFGDGAEHTFQTFDDDKLRKDRRLARTLHGSIAQCAPSLRRFNLNRAGVFFTPNQIVPGRDRKIENLCRVRAVWQDNDNGWTGNFPILPSISIQTSRGKTQCFWRVDGLTPATSKVWKRFSADEDDQKIHQRRPLPSGFFHGRRTWSF